MGKHIPFNVKVQAPFPFKKIGMIVGGTGITPMIQALHAILGENTTDSSTIEVTMLYGSRESNDILGYDLLTNWSNKYNHFKVIHVISHEPDESSTTYGNNKKRGFITKDMIQEYLPSSKEN